MPRDAAARGISSDKRQLEKIEVLDYASLQCVQVLLPSESLAFAPDEQERYIQETDVFRDNPPRIRDVILTTRIVNKGQQIRPDVYRDHFLFDERMQQYRRWASLSEHPNVTVNQDGWPERVEEESTPLGAVVRHYLFAGDGRWKLMGTETRELAHGELSARVAPAPALPVTGHDACLLLPQGVRCRPPVVISPAAGHADVFVRDTFLLRNACEKTIELESTGQFSSSFRCPPAIGPGRQLEGYFEMRESIFPDQVRQVELTCNIKTSHGQTVPIEVHYFLAGANTAVRDSASGLISGFRGRPEDGFASFEVTVDAQWRPVGWGKVIAKSGTRVGQWRFYDEQGWHVVSRQYGRKFTLVIENPDSLFSLAKPEVRERGRWVTPEFYPVDRGFLFYCTGEVDSVRVVSGSRMAGIRHSFADGSPDAGAQLYLMEPGEDFFYRDGARVPLRFSGHQYVIRWNYSAFKGNAASPLTEQQCLGLLKKKYPALSAGPFESMDFACKIELGHLEATGREQTLTDLLAEPCIQGLSRVVTVGNKHVTYADEIVSILFDVGVVPAQYAGVLAKHGFLEMRQQAGTTHYYQARYRNRRCDRDFFEALNALSQEPGIRAALPNFYFRIEPDSDAPGIDYPRDPGN